MLKRISLLVCFLAPVLLQAQPFCGGSTLTVGTGMTYSTIQAARDAASPGDLISVKALGSPYAGYRVLNTSSHGTSGCPITVQGENSSVEITSGSASNNPIRIDQSNYEVVDTLHIHGVSGVNSCIFITNSDFFIVRNVEVDHCGAGADVTEGILTGFSHYGLIENSHFHDNTQHGIYISNEDKAYTGTVVRGNEMDHNSGAGIQLNGDCQTADSFGGTTGTIVGVIIERNSMHNNVGNGLSNISASYGLIRNNLFYDNGPAANGPKLAAQGGCAQISSNNLIINNTIVATAAGVAGASIRVADQSSASGSPNDWANANNVAFNNLVVNADTRQCVIDSSGAACDGGGTSGMFFAPGYFVTTANIATVLFTNASTFDFSLQTSSPAINAVGLLASYQGGKAPQNDYLNHVRFAIGSGFSAGAYEYNGSTQAADTTPPTTPPAPTGQVGAFQIVLSWTASTDNRELLGYRVLRNGTVLSGTFTNSFTDSSITPGTAYTYTIEAFDDGINLSTAGSPLSVTAAGVSGCLNADFSSRQPPPYTAPTAAPFYSVLIPDQSSDFTFRVTGYAFAAADNAAIALGPDSPVTGVPSGFSSGAAIIRFNTSGNIDVRNGGSYTADATYPYTPATGYDFRIVIHFATHTYDVFVTPHAGGSETQLAAGYAFRTEQATASHLGYLWGRDDTGAVSVCAPSANNFAFFDSGGAGLVDFVQKTRQRLDTQVQTTTVVAANGTGNPLLDRPALREICNPSCASNTYTLTATDHGALLYYTGSTNITVTVPTGLLAAFASSAKQAGTGTITFSGSGLTLQTPTGTHTSAAGEVGVITCDAADSCAVGGGVH